MKKGQVQMQESIFVIFLVMLLILIGMVSFFKYSSAGIEESKLEYEDYRFKQLIGVIPNLPELRCSHLGVADECVDLLKVNAFDWNYDLFNGKKIEIDGVLVHDDLSCSDVRIVSSPISLYNPLVGRNSVANLEIRWCPE